MRIEKSDIISPCLSYLGDFVYFTLGTLAIGLIFLREYANSLVYWGNQFHIKSNHGTTASNWQSPQEMGI